MPEAWPQSDVRAADTDIDGDLTVYLPRITQVDCCIRGGELRVWVDYDIELPGGRATLGSDREEIALPCSRLAELLRGEGWECYRSEE